MVSNSVYELLFTCQFISDGKPAGVLCFLPCGALKAHSYINTFYRAFPHYQHCLLTWEFPGVGTPLEPPSHTSSHLLLWDKCKVSQSVLGTEPIKQTITRSFCTLIQWLSKSHLFWPSSSASRSVPWPLLHPTSPSLLTLQVGTTLWHSLGVFQLPILSFR